MADEPYRSREECKPSGKQREPYYIHTASGREPVKPSTTPIFKAPKALRNPSAQEEPLANDTALTLVNPRHPPELCPPSSSRWQKLKEENEQRKSSEVTRVSYDEVSRISGRDERGFKHGEDEGWTDKARDAEAKRVWDCCVM